MRTKWIAGGAIDTSRGTMPGKYDRLLLDEPTNDGAERGQVVIMFAIFAIAMMGVLGLATDVGYSMAAKRSVQGAADSGALAGARMIARYTTAAPTKAQSEVTAVVQKNTFGPVTPTIKSCEYIGENWAVVGTCNQNVPSNAAGARVKTRATFKTWFIHIIPGAPKTVTVGGYAKARVQNASKVPSDAPFIICGSRAWDVTSTPTGTGSSIGTTLSLFSNASPMTINPAAIGRTFRVHDANLQAKTGVSCGAASPQFTGLAKQSTNGSKSRNSWFSYQVGGTPGATRTAVNGAGGCAAGLTKLDNCVMILPVAKSGTAPNNADELYVVGFAAFQITRVDDQTHNATLLDDYIITGTGGDAWCRDCGGMVVIRLIW